MCVCVYFLLDKLRGRNQRVLKVRNNLLNHCSCFFLRSLASRVSMYIERASMPSMEFVNWVESKEGSSLLISLSIW